MTPVRLRRYRRRPLVHVVSGACVVVDLRILRLAVDLAGQEAREIPAGGRDGEILRGVPNARVGADKVGLERGDKTLAMFSARPRHGRG